MAVAFGTERFDLRELRAEDATERYLAWLADADATRHVAAAAATKGLSDLRDYITARSGRTDVLFLGIFDRTTGMHIGNIKYEPVDSERGFAIMGILVGDPSWRGKGVATEVLTASALWLKANRQVTQVVLGVSLDNPAAIRAYERAGFVAETTAYHPDPPAGTTAMVLHL